MIVGIDIGGSTTDAVILDNGDVHVVTIEANDPIAAAAGALGKLVETYGMPLEKDRSRGRDGRRICGRWQLLCSAVPGD